LRPVADPTRLLALGAALGLALLAVAWHPGPAMVGALPALLAAALAWRGARAALAWTGFIALGYLAHGLMELVANPPRRGSAMLECLLALGLLVACADALRRRARPSRTGS